MDTGLSLDTGHFRRTKDHGKLKQIYCQRLTVGLAQVFLIASLPHRGTNHVYQFLTASRALLNVTGYK